MSRSTRRFASLCTLAVLVALAVVTAPVGAIIDTRNGEGISTKEFGVPELYIRKDLRPVQSLVALDPGLVGLSLPSSLAALGASPENALYDLRSGTWAGLVVSHPFVPGSGVGNHLSWGALGLAGAPQDMDEMRNAVWTAFDGFLAANAAALGVAAAEVKRPTIAIQEEGRLIYINSERMVNGHPVRDARITAAVNHGNLILFGVHHWGAIDAPATATVSETAALAAVESHVAPWAIERHWRATRLEYIPTARGADLSVVEPGNGYDYRLAWVVSPKLAGEGGSFEALVDATSGELFSFADLNQNLVRRTIGAVLPRSNDGAVPDGVEQPGHPMPFLDVLLDDGSTVTTSAGGIAEFDGPITSSFTGPYITMNDNCGPTNEVTGCQDLDFLNIGSDPSDTDCVVPVGSTPGNTRSSRTGFYELNRLIEQAKGWLCTGDPECTTSGDPARVYLTTPLLANMNVDDNCNANFAFTETNFFTSGRVDEGIPGDPSDDLVCRNTGESAAVFDHEWGHGLDFYDGNGLSESSEAYADITAILRLNTSCIGRGFFFQNGRRLPQDNLGLCDGNGDYCLSCSGVREDNWKERLSQQPHDLDWILETPDSDSPGGCNTGATNPPLPTPPVLTGPCGGGVHCEGQVSGEAIWDLLKRDLICLGTGWEDVPGTLNPVAGGRCVGDVAPTMDENTALEIMGRNFYLAKSNIVQWFECTLPDPVLGQLAGCDPASGYMSFLSADDDNGNLADGTPHAQAIYDAHSRHQVACDLAGTNPGPGVSCAATPRPTAAPTVTTTAGINSATVTWTSVADAEEYWVFRTEGILGCSHGKVRVAVVSASDPLEFTDTELLDGFDYLYSVMPIGGTGGVASLSCSGPMSDCSTVSPLAPDSGGSPIPSMAVVAQPDGFQILSGDGDPYLDNCEQGRFVVDVVNNGETPLTGVQVVAVRAVDATQTVLPFDIDVNLPIDIDPLGGGCGVPGSFSTVDFNFTAHGLSFDDVVTFEVDVVANEIAGGPVTAILTVRDTESDLVFTPEVTFDFEGSFSEWTVFGGTYTNENAVGGGAPDGGIPTDGWLASSVVQSGACDRARSPILRMTPTTTLSMYVQHNIEPQIGGAWYDRANIGLVDVATNARETVIPDGGLRPYNVPPGSPNGVCAVEGEAGWADAGPGWLDATWTSSALGVDGLPPEGKEFRVEAVYGTDPLVESQGFQFDQVVVTDVFARGPDATSDVCLPSGPCGVSTILQQDDFETGDTSGWGFTRNPQGDLSVSDLAALDGFDFGLQVDFDRTGGRRQLDHYVTSSHADVSNYCWQYLIDPNDAPGRLRVFGARAANGRHLLDQEIRRTASGEHQIRLRVRLDNGSLVSLPWTTIPNAAILVGGEWSTTGEGGVLRQYIGGLPVQEQTGIGGMTRLLRTPGMGNLGSVRNNTVGSVYLDAFVSGWNPPI